MAYWAVYEVVSGELRSHGTKVADPLPAELAKKDVVTPPGDMLWDTTTQTFVARPAEAVRSLRSDFLAQAEITGLAAASRTEVVAALDRVLADWAVT